MNNDLLDRIIADPAQPFAMICRELDGVKQVELLALEKHTSRTIDDGLDRTKISHYGTLLVLPYRQVAERGFKAVDDGTDIYTLPILERETQELSLILERLPDIDLAFSDPFFDIDDRDFAELVGQIIDTEIAKGSGSNFVLHRKLCSIIERYAPAHLLTMFKRLLIAESNAHWVYVIYSGDHGFVGASPELHAGLRDNVLTMNPISGTFPRSAASDREELRAFLSDEKEISELFMVVDEELKAMAQLCPDGVRVSGPHLQWLRSVVHTEYKLTGRTAVGVPEILRQSIPMPTVTGSPVRSACDVIAKYEPYGRGFYSGVIALVEGLPPAADLDSVISIRTAEISASGQMSIGAGATIVRDSQPEREAAETAAKAGSVFNALATRSTCSTLDPELERILTSRNRRLSGYWLMEPIQRITASQQMRNIRALVVDAHDSFIWMLCSLLRSAGATVEVCPVEQLDRETGLIEPFDLVVAGPGPGDPRNVQDPRIAGLRRLITHLLATGMPFFAVCLSHQVLCSILGIPLQRLPTPNQGTQRPVSIAGTATVGGFYNSYAGVADPNICESLRRTGVTPVTATQSIELDGLIGPTFASVQFHPESILTIDGQSILQGLLNPILKNSQPQASTEVVT